MQMPSLSSPIWNDLVTGKNLGPIKFLGAKIMLGRLTRKVQLNPSHQNIQECSEKIRDLYISNAELPCVKHDLENLFAYNRGFTS